MNIVLFLGAGFSAPFGLPTMTEFLGKARTSWRIEDDDKTFIENLMAEAGYANRILESSPTNLEDILSFAIMGDRLRQVENNDENVTPRVKHILHRIYSNIENPQDYVQKLNSLGNFLNGALKKLATNGSLNIITTNYDLIVENILFHNNVLAALPFDYEVIPDKRDLFLYDNNGIGIFKLHGSLNWNLTEGKKLVIDDRIISVGNLKTSPCSKADYSYSGEPLIVPPTFLKPDLPEPLLRTWAGAANCLKNAELIIFIGYSFPASDIEMKYFLANCLTHNTKIDKIVICDLKAESIVERLQKQESGYGSHFKKYLKPVNGNWAGINLVEKDVSLF